MDFIDLNKKINILQNEVENTLINVKQAQEEVDCAERLDGVMQEINQIAEQIGAQKTAFKDFTVDELNMYVNLCFLNDGLKVDADKQYDMQGIDYLVSAISGGLAIIVDVFLVKIPTDTMIVRNGNRIFQEGSSLTDMLRSIGRNKDGQALQWVTTLEKWFKVPYDKSVDPDILGLNPKTHRLHSLAHDPSLLGLLWAIKDIVTGTFSSIDRNGCLVVEKVIETDYLRLFTAPILWLGHLISDIFTKMGIPIPGWSYLQLLQFGNLGEKQRTISEVARYMYLEGYDLRHLVSMSTTNAVIEIVVRLYYFLVCKKKPKEFTLNAEKEYVEIKNKIKLHNMLSISYAVASCGNIAKICAYQGNPNAFNLPLWLGMIKEAICQVSIQTRSTKCYEKVIENRHIIDENFKVLSSIMNKEQ